MTPPPPLLRSGGFLHPPSAPLPGELAAKLTERSSPTSAALLAVRTPWLPFQGNWLGAAETERLLQICIEKPKPQI